MTHLRPRGTHRHYDGRTFVTVVTALSVVARMRIAITAVVLLAACARPSGAEPGATEPPPSSGGGAPSTGAGGQQVTLDFQQGQGSSSTGGAQTATATGESGQVAVRGSMETPNPCFKLSGDLQRSGQTLTVTVTGRADPEAMCIQSIGSVPYTATIRGVAPGTYTVRVTHTYAGTGWQPAPALDTQVTVR